MRPTSSGVEGLDTEWRSQKCMWFFRGSSNVCLAHEGRNRKQEEVPLSYFVRPRYGVSEGCPPSVVQSQERAGPDGARRPGTQLGRNRRTNPRWAKRPSHVLSVHRNPTTVTVTLRTVRRGRLRVAQFITLCLGSWSHGGLYIEAILLFVKYQTGYRICICYTVPGGHSTYLLGVGSRG